MWICSHAYVTNNDQTIELSNIKHGETWVGRRGWGKGGVSAHALGRLRRLGRPCRAHSRAQQPPAFFFASVF